jgi:hypothetical protein
MNLQARYEVLTAEREAAEELTKIWRSTSARWRSARNRARDVQPRPDKTVHFEVTQNPIQVWLAQQITEAFPGTPRLAICYETEILRIVLASKIVSERWELRRSRPRRVRPTVSKILDSHRGYSSRRKSALTSVASARSCARQRTSERAQARSRQKPKSPRSNILTIRPVARPMRP